MFLAAGLGFVTARRKCAPLVLTARPEAPGAACTPPSRTTTAAVRHQRLRRSRGRCHGHSLPGLVLPGLRCPGSLPGPLPSGRSPRSNLRGQPIPLPSWIKDIIIKLASALFHVDPGPPFPSRGQGHISEFVISVLAKTGKKKFAEPGVSLRHLTNLTRVLHRRDFPSARDSSHGNRGPQEERGAPCGIYLGGSGLQ